MHKTWILAVVLAWFGAGLAVSIVYAPRSRWVEHAVCPEFGVPPVRIAAPCAVWESDVPGEPYVLDTVAIWVWFAALLLVAFALLLCTDEQAARFGKWLGAWALLCMVPVIAAAVSRNPAAQGVAYFGWTTTTALVLAACAWANPGLVEAS